MTLVQKLLLGGVPTVAAGGAGVGVMLMRNSRGENGSLVEEKKEVVVSGIKVGEDATTTTEPEDLIRQAGLNCGSGKETGKVCGIGSTGLNVDRENSKKEGLFPSGTDNGNIKFRKTEDSTYNNGYRFTVTEKPIKLQGKDNSSEIITLEKYENYGLVKNSDGKVYLTRKLTADQGKIKSLGLPDTITLPTTIETTVTSKELSADQMKLVNFEGKQADKTASGSNKVNINTYKVNDTTTFPGGYRFSFQPHQDLTLPDNSKLPKDVWWDFRIKDPKADDLVLERVWKNEDDLFNTVGLDCKGNSNTCTIKEGSLKIKVGTSTIENGKKKTDGGNGTLYLERKRSGHYEGLRFEVWGGEITIVSASSPQTTLKMEETEIFHISKEDSTTSSYYLERKHDLKEMILYHLGLNKSECTLPVGSTSSQCTVQSANLGNIKFYEGGGEKKITGNNGSLSVTITIATGQESTYPFGYKFSLKTDSGNISVGGISLTTSDTDFKIRKDVDKKKLYLEKVAG